MKYQVTSINFDFTDDTEDFELPPTQQEEIISEVKSTVWEACDEDDLIEEITCATRLVYPIHRLCPRSFLIIMATRFSHWY